jgi:hypothetical protein
MMVRKGMRPKPLPGGTGIDAETITASQLAFAGARRPLALYGRGKGKRPEA